MGLTKDLHFTPPVRKTRRDKLNRFWPNVRYLGAGIVGLAEYSHQVDKGDARKIHISEALKNLTVRVTGSKVFLTVPKVHVYNFYSGSKYTDELYDRDEWDGRTANVGVRCILYTGNYQWRDVDVKPILDQYNQDYSYYSGLGLTIHRRPDNTNGRNQTEEEAKKIDDMVKTMLAEETKAHRLTYYEFDGDQEGYDRIYHVIKDLHSLITKVPD